MMHETAKDWLRKRGHKKSESEKNASELAKTRGQRPKNVNDPSSDESRLAAQRRSDGSSLHFWSSWSSALHQIALHCIAFGSL